MSEATNTTTFRTRLGYGLYTAIAIGCGLGAFLVGPATLKAIVAFPGAISLAAIPWQIFRDQRAHERAVELADRNSAIALGVDSPMAKAAFENYAIFAQEYADKMAEVISEIMREGPRGNQLRLSQSLAAIRRKQVLWIPSTTDTTLFKLEDAILQMAIAAGFTDNVVGRDDQWREMYNRAHKKWNELIGLNHEPVFAVAEPATKDEVTINLQQVVLTELRRVLGTEDYALIRALAIKRALNRE